MKSVNMHEAKTHLSRLVDKVSKGESFIIAKAGMPMAKVTPIDTPLPERACIIGSMKDQIKLPDDFNLKNDFNDYIEDIFDLK